MIKGWTFTSPGAQVIKAVTARMRAKYPPEVSTMSEVLSCGHPPTPDSGCGTGYATTRDTNERICYSCADARERESLKTQNTFAAYLSGDSKHLTTWTGGVLATVTHRWFTSAGGFARGTTITRFRATDVHGQRWYGTSPGPNMYARMRKAKDTK